MFQEINKDLLLYLNSFTDYTFIQVLVSYFADTPIFFLPIFLISLWIYFTYSKTHKSILKKENLLYIFYSVLIGILISLGIQQVVYLERPEEAIKGVGMLLLDHIPDASFPSDHATVAVAFLTSLFFTGYKKIGIFFSFFVAIMLLSRIIVGVHWPFDIVAGIAVGIFSSFITFKYLILCKKIKKINLFIIKILGYIKL